MRALPFNPALQRRITRLHARFACGRPSCAGAAESVSLRIARAGTVRVDAVRIGAVRIDMDRPCMPFWRGA